MHSSKASRYKALVLASAGLVLSACSTTSVTSVSPAAPPPSSAIVRVDGAVARSKPEYRRFALATETRGRLRESVETELFEAVRAALEQKGYEYTADEDSADVVVFVNYGIAQTIATPFASRDLDVVEKRVEVEREPVAGDTTVVTTTTTTRTVEPRDERGLHTAYVDLVAYDQRSLKKEELWTTYIEGLGWDIDRVHDLALLVETADRLIASSTPTVSLPIR